MQEVRGPNPLFSTNKPPHLRVAIIFFMGRTITGIGETVLDIVIKEGQALAAVPGGSVFNALVSLGRTAVRDIPGVTVEMISRLGDDAVAGIISAFMRENGISDAAMAHFSGQTPLSLAVLDHNNNATYEFFRDSGSLPFPVPEAEVNKDDLVLFGSVFAIDPGTAPQTRDFIRRARKAGAIVYYDINFRKNHPAKPEEIDVNISLSDIVRGSSEDIASLYGTGDAAAVYAERIAPFCPNFICTRGAEDATVFSPGVCCSFPVAGTEKVVSTIGAGDNFNAGVLYALARDGFTKEAVHRLSAADWAGIIPTAMRFSANVCGSLFNYVEKGFTA